MAKGRLFRAGYLLACLTSVSPCIVHAQTTQGSATTADPAESEQRATDTDNGRNDTEIVVTARKVGEKIQDIPLSITAFSEQTLARRDITNLDALAKAAPGISLFQGNDRSYGVLTFRGMRNNSNFDSTRENSSIFIDGVYYIGTPANLNFDDIQRVEIVKGPQSAFFGRSTFGGAINFITKTPSNDLHSSIFIRAATYKQVEARASLEGPLVKDVLDVRVNGRYETFGGMYKNVLTGENLGKQKTASVSGSFKFTPTPELNIRGHIGYVQQDDGAPASQLIGRRPTHNCTVAGATRYCGLLQFSGDAAIAPVTPLALPKVPETGLHRKFTDMSLNASYDLGGGYSITSLTGHQHEQLTNVDNYSHTADDVYDFSTSRRQEATSEELRVSSPQSGRLRVLAGLYYIKQNYNTNSQYIYGTQNPYAAFVGGAGSLTAAAPVTKTIVNKAVFGSAAFDLTSKLTASVEARYQNDKVNNTDGGTSTQFSTSAFLPRVILDYKVVPGVMLYGSIADGNKPTQANAAVLALSADRQAIAAAQGLSLVAREEKVRNYELGIKTQFMGGRITLNADAFYADWKNKQSSGSVSIDFNGDGRVDPSLTGANREYFTGVIVPQGNERVTGFEVEGTLVATRELTLSGSFAYTNPRFRSPTIIPTFSGTVDASGQQEPYISKYSATGSIDYRRKLSGDTVGFLRADLNYLSSRFASILNEAYTGDAYLLNLKVGVDTGPVTVTLYVDNVLQDKTLSSLMQQGDSALDPARFAITAYEAALARKRQFGLTIAGRF